MSSAGSSMVAEILRRSGLSQAELSRRAGLPPSVVNAYLRGHREPGADNLARLAAAGGLKLGAEPRRPPVDPARAGQILVDVLALADELPFRRGRELTFPGLPRATVKGRAA